MRLGQNTQFRGIFSLLCWEGAFAMAYETWIGPVYLSGLAGEAGVSLPLLAVLTSIPWIGSIGQVFGLWAFERWPSRKRYTITVASAARALWSVPLFLAFFWFRKSARFPAENWF